MKTLMIGSAPLHSLRREQPPARRRQAGGEKAEPAPRSTFFPSKRKPDPKIGNLNELQVHAEAAGDEERG